MGTIEKAGGRRAGSGREKGKSASLILVPHTGENVVWKKVSPTENKTYIQTLLTFP